MNKESRRRRGRPSQPTGSRERILEIARTRFFAYGYAAVTLRSIAAQAEVDVALVSYFYGSKAGLFAAVMQVGANPIIEVRDALDAPLEAVPARLLRALIVTWDSPSAGGSLRALAEAAAREPGIRRAMVELLERELVARIAERLGGADASARAAAAMTQLVGLVYARHVLGVGPVASMPADELIRRCEPALRAALAGPLRPRPRP